MNREPIRAELGSGSAHPPLICSQDIVRGVLCFILLFLSAVCQSSFFTAAGFFKATPDLLLCTVAALALTLGEKNGSICGIAAGVFSSALGGRGTLLLPVLYFFVGYILGLVGRKVFRRNILSWTVYMIPVTLFRSMISLGYVMYSENSVILPDVISGLLVPEALMTFFFSFIPYFASGIFLKIYRPARNGDAQTHDLT